MVIYPSEKFGNHVTVHRATAPQAHQCKQPKCYSRFYLERKNNNKVVSFSALFMFTLTWITEKELERVIENKGDEFRRKKNIEIQSGGEKMRNASGQG